MKRKIDRIERKIPHDQWMKLRDEILKDQKVLGTPTDFGGIQEGSKGMTLQEVQAWNQFIEARSWTFFVTWTTGYESSQKQMRRLNERFFQSLKKYNVQDLNYFWVMEKHKHRGYHTHGLLKFETRSKEDCTNDSNSLDREWQCIINEFQRCAGKSQEFGWHRNKVEIFNDKEGATRYCMKYLGKSCTDWDYFIHC